MWLQNIRKGDLPERNLTSWPFYNEIFLEILNFDVEQNLAEHDDLKSNI